MRTRRGVGWTYAADMALRWSSHIVDSTGTVVYSEDAGRLQPTASIGKIFLLAAAADAVAAGSLDLSMLIPRPSEPVADSGLWQHLAVEDLTLGDVAVLTAAVSDNLAANALLDLLGLDAADAAARSLGCVQSRLLDRIRAVRGAGDPIAPSVGRADELAEAVRRIQAQADADDQSTASALRRWLSIGVDLSMVASAFHLDPLAHIDADRGVQLWNKTGTDTFVRADTGVVEGAQGWLAYAALAEWDADCDDRDEAMDRMRKLGDRIRQCTLT